jgi:hypothetical protein
MTRKLRMTAAVVAIGLTPLIGIGTAEADGGGFHGGGMHGGGMHGGHIHQRVFFGGRGSRGAGFGYGGFIGYSDPDGVAETPNVSTVRQPASAVPVDRPPCRETTAEGVVVTRGISCSRGAQ